MSSRKVLFIVYYLPPMGSSGVQRPLKFIKYLSRYNWHPIVLAPEPGAYHTFDYTLQQELEDCDATVYRIQANTPFHKFSRLTYLVNALPATVKRWIRKLINGLMLPDNKKGWIKPALQKAKELIDDHPIELVFSTAPPYSNHMLAAKIKQETDLPVVMDFRDDWVGSQLIEYPTRWHKKRMAKLERQTVSEANAIFVLDRYMKDSFKKRMPQSPPSIHILEHGFDPEDFDHDHNPTIKTDEEKLNVLYSGTFVPGNQPDSFLHMVSKACQQDQELKNDLILHFQGGLANRHKSLIKKLNLEPQVISYGYVPHKTAVANLKKSDVLWLVSDFGEEFKQVTAGKLYEYIGSGKPIFGLVHKHSEEERLLKRYGAAYFVQPHKLEEGKLKLLELYQHWKSDNLPAPDYDWVEQFNRKKLTRKLSNLFAEVVGKNDSGH